MIIVEYKLENYYINKLENYYKKANIVFGLIPNSFSKDKFQHLYNKIIYKNASDNYANFVNNEFIKYYKNTFNPLLVLLDYFEPHLDKAMFILFLTKEIKKKYPNKKIILYTSDKKLNTLYNKSINAMSLEVQLYYFPMKRQNKKLTYSLIISIITSSCKNNLVYYALNYISLILFTLKLIVFKIRYMTYGIKSLNNKILFISRLFFIGMILW